jgi:hypothetical protein
MSKRFKITLYGVILAGAIFVKFINYQPSFSGSDTKSQKEKLLEQERIRKERRDEKNRIKNRNQRIKNYSDTKSLSDLKDEMTGWSPEAAEEFEDFKNNRTIPSSISSTDDNFTLSNGKSFISQPVNGFSPYDSYFGKGKYDYNARNTIIVHTPSSSNIVFLLKDVYSGRTIRNEYIRKNSTFKLTNIPYGTYSFTYISGKWWSEFKILKNGKIKGAFTKNISFSKSEKVKDWMEFNEGYQGQWELSLTQVAGGNIDTESTNEEDFFK